MLRRGSSALASAGAARSSRAAAAAPRWSGGRRTLSVATSAKLLEGFLPYTLLEKHDASPSAKVLRFALPHGEALGGGGRSAPTGVKVLLPGTALEKSYSPVSHPALEGSFDLLVRAYPPRPGGGLGAYLCDLKPGDSAAMKVKPPRASFLCGGPLTQNRWERLGLVACGTGLAPFVQVIRQVLGDPGDRTRLSLVYVNREEEEILMRRELEELQALHSKRLQVSLALTRPGGSWLGAQGRPDEDMMREHLPPPGPGTLVLVCGTDGFVESVAGPIQRIKGPDGGKKKLQGPLGGVLARLGYTASMVHKF